MKRVKLGKNIRTIDDLLADEGVEWIIDQLIKEKADLVDVIVIKFRREGVRQIITTLQDTNRVLAELQRAIYWQVYNERIGLESEVDDNEDDDE